MKCVGWEGTSKGTLVGAAILAHNSAKRKQNMLRHAAFDLFIRSFLRLSSPEVADYGDRVGASRYDGLSIGCVDATDGYYWGL
jgi:hypothetical protein